MRTFLRWTLAVALMGVFFATSAVTVHAGDFSDGWNTWEDAKKGDWVEYKSASGFIKRYDVIDAKSGDITLKVTQTPIDDKGNLGKPVEGPVLKPLNWNKIGMLGGKIPKGDCTWTKEKVTVGVTDIDNADVVTWVIGQSTFVNIYSKEVPCGGMVSASTNKKVQLWLVKWHCNGKDYGDIKQALPKFWAKAGNSSVTRATRKEGAKSTETYAKTEIKKVDGLNVTYTVSDCDKAGKLAGAASAPITHDASDLTKPYSKPDATGEKVTVPAGEFACDVCNQSVTASEDAGGGTTTTKTWITADGVIVKRVTNDGKVETTEELMTVDMK